MHKMEPALILEMGVKNECFMDFIFTNCEKLVLNYRPSINVTSPFNLHFLVRASIALTLHMQN